MTSNIGPWKIIDSEYRASNLQNSVLSEAQGVCKKISVLWAVRAQRDLAFHQQGN